MSTCNKNFSEKKRQFQQCKYPRREDLLSVIYASHPGNIKTMRDENASLLQSYARWRPRTPYFLPKAYN
jgi:hypothetical protein